MQISLFRTWALVGSALLATIMSIPKVAGQSGVRATIQPVDERKVAPAFVLTDSSGKTVKLKRYRGKIVLLDFWATWCHGCKEEIPWFSEFDRKYRRQGLSVVGVSLDEDGWKVVKPFIKEKGVPYRILLGNNATAKQYGIENMPDTFLIDGEGRIAAKYVGIVDKEDVESNLKSMLSQR